MDLPEFPNSVNDNENQDEIDKTDEKRCEHCGNIIL